jgi:hypothetical protein
MGGVWRGLSPIPSKPRRAEKSTAPRQAWDGLSYAWASAYVMRRFSRASHSASTSRPRRSSKVSCATAGVLLLCYEAFAIAPSFMARSMSRVGLVSIPYPPPLVVAVARSADMLVRLDRRLNARAFCAVSGMIQAMLEDGVDVAITSGRPLPTRGYRRPRRAPPHSGFQPHEARHERYPCSCQRSFKKGSYIKFSWVCGRDVSIGLHFLFEPGWSGWLSSVEGGSSKCRI